MHSSTSSSLKTMWAERLFLLVCGLSCGVAAVVGCDSPKVVQDQEWMLHDGILAAENEERDDPAPDGEASTENEDES